MNFTEEQQQIIEKIQDNKVDFLKVSACAGAGKTATLIGIAKELKPKTGLYLAYNKAIAVESKGKFPNAISCMTTHSLAYQNTVKPYKLSVGIFNWKSIKEYMPYEKKLILLDIMSEFCLSRYNSIDDFFESNKERSKHIELVDPRMKELTQKYIKEMFSGKIDITHEGYLKMYHMLLQNGQIQHKEFGLIMLDECGDLNEVTLEIFKLLPAKKKIMVGDISQNIYQFNKTINGFKAMENEGDLMSITKSFRCDPKIAKRIEGFMQEYSDDNYTFDGTAQEDKTIRTIGYVSRTNSALVGKIIDLIKINEPFTMLRKPQVVFELVLILMNLKPGGKIFSKEWKFLQEDVENWNTDKNLQKEYKTAYMYISTKYAEDPAIKSATSIIGTYGFENVYMAYDYAKKHELDKKKYPKWLSTVHSSKGLEADQIEILDDLNSSFARMVENHDDFNYAEPYDNEKEIEIINLYYVACSRAIKEIKNAVWLPGLETTI